jgi:hypothetical protein
VFRTESEAAITKGVFGSKIGTEWNSFIMMLWDDSDPMFGSEKIKQHNGSIFCSILESHNGMK